MSWIWRGIPRFAVLSLGVLGALVLLLIVSDLIVMHRVREIEKDFQSVANQGTPIETIIEFLENSGVEYLELGRTGDVYGHQTVSQLAGIQRQLIGKQIRATVTVYRPLILGHVDINAYYLIDTNEQLIKCHLMRRDIMF